MPSKRQPLKITIERELNLFKEMLFDAGLDPDAVLQDWIKNYKTEPKKNQNKKKQKITNHYNKFRPDQQAIFDKWNKFSDKALGLSNE